MKTGLYNVLDYGAGKGLASEGMQAAIDRCAEQGGGVVVVPPGEYLCGTIRLKSNVDLHLMRGAVLKASENLADYNAEDEYPQNFSSHKVEEWRGLHLILCVEQQNVALTGDGVIDGNGDAFYERPINANQIAWKDGYAAAKDKEKLRPGQLVCFIECRHVKVKDIRIRNATCWGVFLHGCDYAQIRGIEVHNPPHYANTDGIDIDTCSHVTVSDCIIDTGDDAIAIRGAAHRLKNKDKACEYVTVSNCVLSSSCSVIRVGIGYSHIRHVRVSNIVIGRGAVGIHIQTSYNNSQCTSIYDVGFQHISAHNISRPFEISAKQPGYIRNIAIENYRCDATSSSLVCSDEKTCLSDIRLRDIDVTVKDDPRPMNDVLLARLGDIMFVAENVDGLKLRGVRIGTVEGLQRKWKAAVKMTGCENADMRDCSWPDGLAVVE